MSSLEANIAALGADPGFPAIIEAEFGAMRAETQAAQEADRAEFTGFKKSIDESLSRMLDLNARLLDERGEYPGTLAQTFAGC